MGSNFRGQAVDPKDFRVVSDFHVDKRRVRPDTAVLTDAGVAAQLRIGVNRSVLSDRHVGINPCRSRIDDGDALQHPVPSAAAIVFGPQFCQLRPVVAAFRLRRV